VPAKVGQTLLHKFTRFFCTHAFMSSVHKHDPTAVEEAHKDSAYHIVRQHICALHMCRARHSCCAVTRADPLQRRGKQLRSVCVPVWLAVAFHLGQHRFSMWTSLIFHLDQPRFSVWTSLGLLCSTSTTGAIPKEFGKDC